MTVAVLDNGICADELKTPTRHFSVGSSVKSDFIQTDHESHGTVCAKIIEKYSSADEILDVTFIGEDGRADISDLSDALDFCLSEKVDVISLSCGIEDYNAQSKEYKRLSDICKRLSDKNVKIFAAQNNIGRLTIPAALSFTISVEQKDRTQNKLTAIYRKSDIYTDGRHLISLGNSTVFTEACNSFACAYAAATNMDIDKGYKDQIETIDSETKRLIEKESKNYPKADIPVIHINAGVEASDLAGKLKARFLAEGYNADILSSNKDDTTLGAFFVPKESIHDYINLFAYFNDNDVVIVIAKGLGDAMDLLDAKYSSGAKVLYNATEDVVILFENGVPVLKTENSREQVDDFETMFQKILDYYNVET